MPRMQIIRRSIHARLLPNTDVHALNYGKIQQIRASPGRVRVAAAPVLSIKGGVYSGLRRSAARLQHHSFSVNSPSAYQSWKTRVNTVSGSICFWQRKKPREKTCSPAHLSNCKPLFFLASLHFWKWCTCTFLQDSWLVPWAMRPKATHRLFKLLGSILLWIQIYAEFKRGFFFYHLTPHFSSLLWFLVAGLVSNDASWTGNKKSKTKPTKWCFQRTTSSHFLTLSGCWT